MDGSEFSDEYDRLEEGLESSEENGKVRKGVERGFDEKRL